MIDKAIIFLHGWGGSKESLKKLAELTDSEYRKIVPEMPGHGETKEMNSPWSMEDFAKWVKAGIDRSNINEYILVGHSFGGKIILEGVTSGIFKPEKIFLIDSNGIKPKNTLKKTILKKLSSILEPLKDIKILAPLKKLFYRFVIRERDYISTEGNVKESFKLFNEQHYDEKLQNIAVPTIIIWGNNDKITPLWMAKNLNRNIENSKLFVLEGTHGLPLHRPKDVAKIINTNLND